VTKKIGLGLGGFVLCCEIQTCHARRHNDIGGHSSFVSTSLVSLFCAWNISTVEINSGVHLLKSSIRQVPLFTSVGFLGLVSNGLGLLVLLFWS